MNYKKLRGQAFETMMLVISVIVAVAILTILLSFLGVINIFGENAKTVIPQMIKNIESKGAGIELKANAQFDQGIITTDELTVDTPVQQSNIIFHCPQSTGGGTLCGTSGSVPILITQGSGGESSTITMSKKTNAAIAVCKSSRSTNYHICIGTKEKATDLSTECLKCCGPSDTC